MPDLTIATTAWGIITDRAGNVRRNVAFTITDSGGTVVASGTTNSDGEIPGTIAAGSYTLSVLGETFAVEAASGSTPAVTPSGPAGGDLAGNFPNPTIAAGAVGPDEIATDGVGTAEIAPGAVGASEVADALKPSVDAVPGDEALRAAGSTADTFLAGNTPKLDTVQDEGTPLTQRPALNFIGAGVTAVDNPGQTSTDVTIPGAAGGSGYTAIEDEATALTARTTLRFAGAGVTATDSGGRTLVTIPGSSGAPNTTFVHNVKLDYGAVGDGTTPDTTAIQNAIDAAYAAGGGIVYFPPGTYLCVGLLHKSNVTLLGTPGAKLKKNGGGQGTQILGAIGSTTGSAINATATIEEGVATITVASTTGIVAGDYIVIRDSTYVDSTYGRNQELNRVLSVTATVITLVNRTISRYTTALTAQVAELLPVVDATVDNLRFEIPTGTGGGGVHAQWTYGFTIQNCTVTGANHEPNAIRFTQSAYGRALNNIVRDGQNLTTHGVGYGINVYEGSHQILIAHNHIENCRENVISYNSRYVAWLNNTLVNHEDSGIVCKGSGSRHILIANNLLIGFKGVPIVAGYAGSLTLDSDISIIGNHIKGCRSTAIYSYGRDSSTKTPRVTIADNVISDFGLEYASSAIKVQDVTDVAIRGNSVTNASYAYSRAGIEVLTGCSWVQINDNQISNLTYAGAQGILLSSNASRITITSNQIRNVASNNINVPSGTTKVILAHNQTDDATNATSGATVNADNLFG